MRLIDADVLIRKICFRCKEDDAEGMCAEFCRFIAALDATPHYRRSACGAWAVDVGRTVQGMFRMRHIY